MPAAKYSEEFKAQVVREVVEKERTIASVAASYDLVAQTVGNYVTNYSAGSFYGFSVVLTLNSSNPQMRKVFTCSINFSHSPEYIRSLFWIRSCLV